LASVECKKCHVKMEIDPEWKPQPGLNQKLRRFMCPRGHEEYVPVTAKAAGMMEKSRENAKCANCGQVKFGEVNRAKAIRYKLSSASRCNACNGNPDLRVVNV